MFSPAIAHTKSQLETIKAESTAFDALEKDIDGNRFIATELKMSRRDADELVSIQCKYIDSLIKNIGKRFESLQSNGVLLAFTIFDPILVPEIEDAGFKACGQDKVKVLASHFFRADEGANDRLQSQWSQMKYHVNENIKAAIPEEVRNGKSGSSTAWFLSQVMKNKVNYQPFFDMLLHIAKVALILPVSNAWPERGASAMKLVKTRCRNSLQNEMLEALLMVLINGPSVKDCGPLVKLAVKTWLGEKKRKKLPPTKITRIPLMDVQAVQQEQDVQGEMTVIPPAVSIPTLSAIDEQTVQEEVAEIGSLLDLPPCSPDSESDSDYASDCEFYS